MEKNKGFEETILGIMNNAATALMLSVGHRTNLFETMSKLPPSTSLEIASAARLDERYVREWLGALVTSKIIDYNPGTLSYSLAKEKAEFLTKDGIYNFASALQFIPVLAYVEDEIVNCFKKGGGVPYESFKRFYTVMAEESEQTVLAALLDKILPLEPKLVDRLQEGIQVMDVGCGSGGAIHLMARTFRNSRFTGIDFSDEAILNAKNEAIKLGLSNAFFEKQDVSNFINEKNYDLITAFDAIHDQAKPQLVLENIKKSLKPDGLFLMQDIRASSKLENNMDHSLAPYLYAVSCFHCMTVSLSQNGMGLGSMWGKELATKMLNDAGFSQVHVKQLPHDPINYYYIVKI